MIFEKLMLERVKGLQDTFLKEIEGVLEGREWYMGYMRRFEGIEQIGKYFKSGRCGLPPTLSS